MKFYSFPLGDDIVDLYLIFLFLWLLFNGGKLVCLPRIVYVYFGYQFFLFFLSLNSFADPWPIIQDFKNFLVLPFLAILVVNVFKDKRDIIYYIIVILLALLWADITYIRNLLSHGNLGVYRDTLRDPGIFVVLGSNELATFYTYNFFLPFSLALFLKVKFKKYFCFLMSILTGIVILFTYSRGAYLSLCISLFCVLFVYRRFSMMPFIVYITLLVVVIMAYQIILPSSVVQRINMTLSHEGERFEERLDPSAQERIMLWTESKRLIIESPIIGHGFEYTYHGLVMGFRDPHNKYIETLIEGGVINLVLFVFLFFAIISLSLGVFSLTEDSVFRALSLSLFGATIVLMVANFFGDRWTYLELGSYYWSLVGVVQKIKDLSIKV